MASVPIQPGWTRESRRPHNVTHVTLSTTGRHRTGSRAFVPIARAIPFCSQLTADGVRHAIRLDMARKKAVSVSPAALGDDSDSSCRGPHSSHGSQPRIQRISEPRADVETVNGLGVRLSGARLKRVTVIAGPRRYQPRQSRGPRRSCRRCSPRLRADRRSQRVRAIPTPTSRASCTLQPTRCQ